MTGSAKEKTRPLKMGRRGFLKLGGALALTGGLALLLGGSNATERVLGAGEEKPSNQVGILIDTTRCIGCRNCVAACKIWNNLPPTELQEGEPRRADLSDTTWTTLKSTFTTGENGHPEGWRFAKYQCMHCLNPSCASACPVGALYKSEEGPVLYDESKCIGCRYCFVACPFRVPRYQWSEPRPLVRKCTMCNDRLEKGLRPACVEVCPTGALQFGDRAALLVEAKQRVAQGGYYDWVYGEGEVGGTSVLYISDVPVEELGFSQVGSEPPPERTEAVAVTLPPLIGMIAAFFGGVQILRNRRNHVGGVGGEAG